MSPILSDTALDMFWSHIASALEAKRLMREMCTGCLKDSHFHGYLRGQFFYSVHASKMLVHIFGRDYLVRCIKEAAR